MENNNLIWELYYQPTKLVKDSNSGLVCKKHLLRVLRHLMCTSKLSDLITLFYYLAPKKTQGNPNKIRNVQLLLFSTACQNATFTYNLKNLKTWQDSLKTVHGNMSKMNRVIKREQNVSHKKLHSSLDNFKFFIICRDSCEV